MHLEPWWGLSGSPKSPYSAISYLWPSRCLEGIWHVAPVPPSVSPIQGPHFAATMSSIHLPSGRALISFSKVSCLTAASSLQPRIPSRTSGRGNQGGGNERPTTFPWQVPSCLAPLAAAAAWLLFGLWTHCLERRWKKQGLKTSTPLGEVWLFMD